MKLNGNTNKKANRKVSEKQPKTGSILLHTYFTSLLSLVLCVCMFMGTSFAWFTSEINNTGNEIYVGILDVGLYKEKEGITYKEVPAEEGDINPDGTPMETKTVEVPTVERQNLENPDVKLFDNSIRWEPGYTALETIQVENQGDLAFTYTLTFTDGTLAENSAANLEDVAKWFDVCVYDHLNKSYTKPNSYQEILASEDWAKVGTLSDVLNGQTVLSGEMISVRKADQEAALINEGTSDGLATVDKFTIALHMNKDAMAPELMGQSITLNVKLVACQKPSETDSFGSDNYDKGFLTATTAPELKNRLNNSVEVVMTSDIVLNSNEDCLYMVGGELNGNNKTLTYNGDKVGEESIGVLNTSGGRIINLTVDGKANGRALYITKLTSDLNVSNCTFAGAYAFNLNGTENTGFTVNFVNTVFNGLTSYTNAMNGVNFTDCTFNSVLRPSGNTVLTECVFDAEGALDVSGLADNVITLNKCTLNGTTIEKVVIQLVDGKAEVVEGKELFTITDNKLAAVANGEN